MPQVITGAAGALDRAAGRPVVASAVYFEGMDIPWHRLRGPELAQAITDVADGTARARGDLIPCRRIQAVGLDGTAWEARQYAAQPIPSVRTFPPGSLQPDDSIPAYAALRHLNSAVLSPGPPAPGH